jgi:hypothetical protein
VLKNKWKTSEKPYIKKTMLNQKGLVGEYVVVHKGEDVKGYL